MFQAQRLAGVGMLATGCWWSEAMQTKATPKERLRTVEEFVEQLEQAVQKRL